MSEFFELIGAVVCLICSGFGLVFLAIALAWIYQHLANTEDILTIAERMQDELHEVKRTLAAMQPKDDTKPASPDKATA